MSPSPVPTILYLEDHEANLRMTSLMLQMEGMSVRPCAAAAEALESIRRGGLPDVALVGAAE